jgi:hypothetical protein
MKNLHNTNTPNKDIPSIAVTGHDMLKEERIFFIEVVKKPVTLEKILGALKQCIV